MASDGQREGVKECEGVKNEYRASSEAGDDTRPWSTEAIDKNKRREDGGKKERDEGDLVRHKIPKAA